MLTVFFRTGPVRDYLTAKTSDTARFAQFFDRNDEPGIYLPPSQFEAWFISLHIHTKDLDQTSRPVKSVQKKDLVY
jgi:glutamate-1-semialdehyde 2,1-aminomutase